ncbi:multiple sugar transport system substrate-binding protein [Pseudoxanthobacter soli DSM 19599]|uniref:sn-glycerol-3-phosphate-binding periplasmic protein UgpB n=1 Tax=Pseudoxanthobacter soli DSM 19599 TaxID=1123029 RepID=A0A1M7ZQ01_9HYPH|nr:ABC transporter substrate-binding protein [Pseudoxanthobacter soli]SHO66993.1 multiple sugar transport system substrate-binding protein [Pseudoxanthobacter soli DSM 19599]
MSKWIQFLAAGCLAAALTGPALAEPITLDVQYAWPSHKRFHDPLAEAFMKAHPDIRIHYLAPAASYTDGQQRVLRGAVTGNLPDVWYSGYSYLNELVRTLEPRGEIVPVSDFLAKESPEWVKENYSGQTLQLGQVQGRQWALPFTASTPIVYYNKDLLDSVGASTDALRSWDGIIATAKKITDGGKADGMSYAANEWGDDWLWQALILNAGGRMMNADNTKVTFGDDSGKTAVTLLRRFVSETAMPFLDEDQAIQQFASGKLGIFIGSTAEVRVMGQTIGGKFHFGTAPYPQPANAEGGLPTGGSAAVILTKDAAKRRAAWEFLKFVTGPEGQKIVVLGSGYMPTNLRTAEPDYLGSFYKDNPDWTTSLKQWPIAKPWFGYPGGSGPRIWDEQKVELSKIMRGQVTPEAGLATLVDLTSRLALSGN